MQRLESSLSKTISITMLVSGAAAIATPIWSYADTIEVDSSEVLIEEKKEIESKIEKTIRYIDRTKDQIKRMEERYQKTEDEIDSVKRDIEETQQRIEKRKDIINNRLSSLQIEGEQRYLDLIFGSKNFGDFISRIYTVNKIVESDQELLDEQKIDQKRLVGKRSYLETKKESLQRQFELMQDKLAELEGQKAEQELLIAELDERIEDAKKREELERQRRIWEELAELQQQEFSAISIDDLEKAYEGIEEAFSEEERERFEKRKEIIQTALNEAKKYLGGKYVWGGAHPSTSFDCSGYTQWSFKQAGVELPRTAAQQYLYTDRIPPSEVKVGDLVFFSYGQGIAHVGIYIGNGKMINSQNSGIKVANLKGYWEQHLVGFGRIPTL